MENDKIVAVLIDYNLDKDTAEYLMEYVYKDDKKKTLNPKKISNFEYINKVIENSYILTKTYDRTKKGMDFSSFHNYWFGESIKIVNYYLDPKLQQYCNFTELISWMIHPIKPYGNKNKICFFRKQ